MPLNNVRDQLCPPIPDEPLDDFADLRQVIAAAISSSCPEIETVLGLEQPTPQFREDLSHAILICVLTHKLPPKRRSQIAKQLRVISKDAGAAAKIGRNLITRLTSSFLIYPPIQNRFVTKLEGYAFECESLSAMAGAHARVLKDPGGKRGLIAFRTLVDQLMPAFESVTGTAASVTWKDIEGIYVGQFLDFMRAVVRLMRRLFSNISFPNSDLAVDIFVYKRVNQGGEKRKKQVKRQTSARSSRRPRVGQKLERAAQIAHKR
jgi:hypothetical protein